MTLIIKGMSNLIVKLINTTIEILTTLTPYKQNNKLIINGFNKLRSK